jgi:hypothetical protein
MKLYLSYLILLISFCATAQTNKFERGDIGIRYGVNFNGAVTQAITLSGMVTNRFEVGAGLNVQYNESKNTNVSTTQIYKTGNIYLPASVTSVSVNKSITIGITPFFVYHFPVKSNLDVYAGANLGIGTNAINLTSTGDRVTTTDGYYNEQYSSYKYPVFKLEAEQF